MTKKQYLEQILKETVDGGRVSEVERVYGAELPEVLKKIISNNEETIFLDDGVRILAFKEILNAKEELHVDFKADGIIPVADCGENDFIVYHFKETFWSKFNIIDEISLKKEKSIEALIK